MTRMGRNSKKRWKQQLSARKGLQVCLHFCEQKNGKCGKAKEMERVSPSFCLANNLYKI
jgi:hypothetical protein